MTARIFRSDADSVRLYVNPVGYVLELFVGGHVRASLLSKHDGAALRDALSVTFHAPEVSDGHLDAGRDRG